MVSKAEGGGEGVKNPGIFALLESLSPSMWLQLLKGFGSKEPMDPVQISEMVKKILGDTPKEGKPELAHLVRILTTPKKEEHLKPPVDGKKETGNPTESRPMPTAPTKLAE